MTSSGDRHVPRAEFVAALEEEVRQAYRATPASTLMQEATPRFAPTRLVRGGGHALRQAAVLALGLVLGVGATMASAQVQDNRTRSEYEAAVALERDVLVMRVRVAREALEKAKQSFAAGAISKDALLAAETEVKVSEIAVAKRENELQEVRATSRAPRAELWAPTVDGRDFVLERLRMDVAAAQERLKVAELKAALANPSGSSGTVVTREAVEREHALREATRVFEVHALMAKLREEAVQKSLPSSEVFVRLQRLEADLTIRAFRQRVEVAEARYTVVVERVKAGLATKLDEKRAELELMESEAALEQAMKDFSRRERPEDK